MGNFFLLFWLYNIFNSLFANDVVNALRASFFMLDFCFLVWR